MTGLVSFFVISKPRGLYGIRFPHNESNDEHEAAVRSVKLCHKDQYFLIKLISFSKDARDLELVISQLRVLKKL